MRLRKLHNATEILQSNPKVFVTDPFAIEKDWKAAFNNSHPIYLEIGMGKGQFVIKNAKANEKINYVGLELNETICAKAIKKVNSLDKDLNNLRIINFNAKQLLDIFDKHSISKIFLNFSDPWPKKRHIKNRLTSPTFLDIYKVILKKDAWVELKTDNDNFFAYTMETLAERKDIEIIYHTNDLHSELDKEINLDNITTEYEDRFISNKKTINKVVFKFL